MEQPKNPVDAVAKRRAAKEYVDRRKERGRCIRCGFDHPDALDWHHDDEKVRMFGVKKDTISEMVNRGDDINKIRWELRKCVLMCSNCHRIHHAKERRYR